MEWIAKADLHTEDGNNWILNYYLQSYDGEDGEKYYGLRIDKSTPEGVLEESEDTLAITESREEILIMAKAFARGCVPPVTLLEMTDDWYTSSLLPT